jgi:hypothetical protein
MSMPLKYQSLCVVGPDRLLKLLGVLSAIPPETRRIRHLFVASSEKGVDVGGDHSAGRCRQLHIDPELDITDLALFQILHFVSSSLETLHVHRTEVYRPSILIDMELPRLRSLTLHGTFQSTNLRHPSTFPCLRRICLHHFVHHPAKFLEQIVHAAPSMTHLHVPQCSFSTYEIQVALEILQPAGDASRLPKSLRNLVIELDPVPTLLDSWAGNIRGEQCRRKFLKIAQRDTRVRTVDGRNHWMSVAEAKEKWLEDISR